MADREEEVAGKSPEKSQNFEKERRLSENQTGQSSSKEKSKDPQTSNKNNNKGKYAVKKRPAPKDPHYHRPNDVYISDRSNFKAQLSKCQKLFDGNYSEVFIHGLGSAIPRAINLALELDKFYQGTVEHSVNTSTIKLIDDLVPLDDETPPSRQVRKVSCVDIHVYRTVKIP